MIRTREIFSLRVRCLTSLATLAYSNSGEEPYCTMHQRKSNPSVCGHDPRFMFLDNRYPWAPLFVLIIGRSSHIRLPQLLYPITKTFYQRTILTTCLSGTFITLSILRVLLASWHQQLLRKNPKTIWLLFKHHYHSTFNACGIQTHHFMRFSWHHIIFGASCITRRAGRSYRIVHPIRSISRSIAYSEPQTRLTRNLC